ncbi:uncharacterized protein LOC113355216 [Papaver somniferum]|uniref:uncharacterized protein LOC113355216 n=1 Tax=Papaver somniferum TaxID=3469 RepID=UPI000E701E48|nr:uncharacterized protein LOC113355216 [Papaver somniferum]
MEHLFFKCHFAKSIWMLPPCPSLLSVHSNASFKEHFFSWMNGVAQDISVESAATKCWFIWKERCNRVFRDNASSSITTSLSIQRHSQFWTPRGELLNPNFLFPRVVNTLHSQPQWAAPGLNELKVNVDAAWKLDANSNTGVAIVVRNHAHTMEGAREGPKSTSSAEETEAIATIEGANWAKEAKISTFSIEGDCK